MTQVTKENCCSHMSRVKTREHGFMKSFLHRDGKPQKTRLSRIRAFFDRYSILETQGIYLTATTH